MTEFFRRFRKFGILISIFLILIGVACISIPGKILVLLDWGFAAGLLIAGILQIFSAIKLSEGNQGKVPKIILGVICIAAAAYLLLSTAVAVYIFGIIVGVLALLSSISQFTTAATAKKIGQPMTWFMVTGIVNLLFALAMFGASFVMISFLVIFIGFYLLFLGIIFLVSAIFFKIPESTIDDKVVETTFEDISDK